MESIILKLVIYLIFSENDKLLEKKYECKFELIFIIDINN